MFRSIVCSFFLITAVMTAVVPEIKTISNDAAVQVLVVDDISKFKDFKQGAELIPIKAAKERNLLVYSLGARVAGDGKVAHVSDNYVWVPAQDVQLTIQYPTNGTGANITFVQIQVYQSSNVGQAYVVSGGIGQNFIVFVVEAYNTFYLRFIADIYGI